MWNKMKRIVGKKYERKSKENVGPPGHEKGVGIGRHGRVDPIDFFNLFSFAKIRIFFLGNIPWIDVSRFYYFEGISLFLKRRGCVTNRHGK